MNGQQLPPPGSPRPARDDPFGPAELLLLAVILGSVASVILAGWIALAWMAAGVAALLVAGAAVKAIRR